MDNHYDDDDDDDFNPAAMPPCMPSPDIILRLVDTWFSGGQPIRTFIFWVVKVLLTLHSLMGVVLICSAVGALLEVGELLLPTNLERLVIVAGREVELDAHSARVCVPLLAGVGEVAAVTAFWSGWPKLDQLATCMLTLQFVLVTYMHSRAAEALLPPLAFVALGTIKVATQPRPRLKND